jgi:hypothetical protein
MAAGDTTSRCGEPSNRPGDPARDSQAKRRQPSELL